MCQLCNSDPNVRERETERLLLRAADLAELASLERDVAHGRIKPHTEQYIAGRDIAIRILRYLAGEWL
jgi:hypothetical protein